MSLAPFVKTTSYTLRCTTWLHLPYVRVFKVGCMSVCCYDSRRECLSGTLQGRSQICPPKCPSLLIPAVILLVQLTLSATHSPRLWSLQLSFQVTPESNAAFHHSCCVRRESAWVGTQAPLVNPMWMGACCESQGAYEYLNSFPCKIR